MRRISVERIRALHLIRKCLSASSQSPLWKLLIFEGQSVQGRVDKQADALPEFFHSF